MSASQLAEVKRIMSREKQRERESLSLVYVLVVCAFVASSAISFVCGYYSVEQKETLEEQPEAVREFAKEYKRLTR